MDGMQIVINLVTVGVYIAQLQGFLILLYQIVSAFLK